MKSGTAADREPKKTATNSSDLDSRYGAVGILAVAAALPYQSEAKNSAYARTEAKPDERYVDAA